MATQTEIMAVYQLRGFATQAEIVYRNAKRLQDLWLALNIGAGIPANTEPFVDGNEQLPLTNNDVILLSYLVNDIVTLFNANGFDKLYRILKASTVPIDWR